MNRTLPLLPGDLRIGDRLQLVCGCQRKLDVYTIVRISSGWKMAWATTPGKSWERIIRAHDIGASSYLERFMPMRAALRTALGLTNV